MNNGYNAMKKAHDDHFALMEYLARENPEGAMRVIASQLMGGFYLVLPSVIYKQAVEEFEKLGYGKEVTDKLYESKPLQAISA